MYTRLNELFFFLAGIGIIYAVVDYLRRRNRQRTLPVLIPFLVAALLWVGMDAVARSLPTASWLIFNNFGGIALDALIVLGTWGYVLYRDLLNRPARPGGSPGRSAKK